VRKLAAVNGETVSAMEAKDREVEEGTTQVQLDVVDVVLCSSFFFLVSLFQMSIAKIGDSVACDAQCLLWGASDNAEEIGSLKASAGQDKDEFFG